MSKSSEYLHLARRMKKKSKIRSPCIEHLFEISAKDYGVRSQAIEELVNPGNWRTGHPRVIIQGDINQKRDLAVKWHPLIADAADHPGQIRPTTHGDVEFYRPFLQRCYAGSTGGQARPLNELLYFKNARILRPISWNDYPVIVYALFLGLVARYEELLKTIGSTIKISGASTFCPVFCDDLLVDWVLEWQPNAESHINNAYALNRKTTTPTGQLN